MSRQAVILALVGSVAIVSAQAPEQTAPAFEVASVKRNDSGGTGGGVGLRPNGYAATNTPLRTMILHAYELKRFQLVGGPSWIDAERFDAQARAGRDATDAQLFAMVRALLADRFKLRVRRERREEQPIYALVKSRDDGKLGPQLKPSTVDCSPRQPVGRAGPPPGDPLPPQRNPCGLYVTSFGDQGGTVTTKARTLADLASAVGGTLDRPVVDRTGLEGVFEFDLKWGADGTRITPGAGGSAANDTPSLFTALQEQLGLRLESARGPVEVLVIDSVERPTPD
jgi:uncharacterized protein (TIGR03435 family)